MKRGLITGAACLALMVGLSGRAISNSEAEAETSSPIMSAAERNLAQERADLSDPIPLVRYTTEDGTEHKLTNVDIASAIWSRVQTNADLPFEILAGDPETVLKPAIQEAIKLELLHDKAEADEDFKAKNVGRSLLNFLMWRLQSLIIQEQVFDKATPVTDEMVENYFLRNRDQYNKPLQFTMRNIFLMTYVPYTTKEGDTLESIAQDISNDPSRADEILMADTKQPRAPREVPNNAESESESAVELKAGEELLVPMSEQKKDDVYRQMKDIKQKLNEGGDFKELAEQYSDAPSKGEIIGPLPQGNRMLLDEVLEAGMQLEKEQVSDILETKHGYMIIKVLDKTGPTSPTLEEVSGEIREKIQKDFRAIRLQQFYGELSVMEGVEIYEDVLSKEKPEDSEVVARVGDKKYTWSDFRKLCRGDIPQTFKERRRALTRHNVFRNDTFKHFVNVNQLDRRPDVRESIRSAQRYLIADEYLQKMVKDKLDSMEDVPEDKSALKKEIIDQIGEELIDSVEIEYLF